MHCPKCGNDIIFIKRTVPIETIKADTRQLKCDWPKCGWEGQYFNLVDEEDEEDGAGE
jgi:predicted RNA-binding Zn-ribbon protein involved in translation (DUF1610 family)